MLTNDYEYEYNILVGELLSLCSDFDASLQYQLLTAGVTHITYNSDLISQLEAAGLTVTDATVQIQDEAIETYDRIYQLRNDIPNLTDKDSYIDITNLFLNTFYPGQNTIEEKEFNIDYQINEYAEEVKTEIETSVNDVFTSIFEVKQDIDSNMTEDNNFINKIVSDNIDFIESSIDHESDAFFEWFTAEAQNLADPILSEASIMYKQVKKIAEEAAQAALSSSSDIYDNLNEFKDEISSQISDSIGAVVGYVDRVTAEVKDFYDETIADIQSSIEDVKESVKDIVKPLFSAKDKMIDYFMNIVVLVFEKMTEEIPDITLKGI
jgi:uncharacterized lipoprotein YehR (DUF1307 family)